MTAPRPQFYHPAKVIDAALHDTERAIRRAEGITIVIGQPGMGKSLLLAMIAEHVRDDFDVALLSGARICTRRALWQSILAEIGEPYRGIDEVELRIALVERIRGLAATGSGLVILVDEAQTLPTRLIEELRLLTNVPTPLPAVHIVLAGSTKLEELLALPRMESLAQRIAVRNYLEPLDHAETTVYVRGQMRAAGLDWDAVFDAGCDDAVFAATDGVPRLVNQLCDHALLAASGSGRRVKPGDIAAAWRELQRLPAPAGHGRGMAMGDRADGGPDLGWPGTDDAADADGTMVMEFGEQPDDHATGESATAGEAGDGSGRQMGTDPWGGPDVELVFDAGGDPFAEFFEHDRDPVERRRGGREDDFSGCVRVTNRTGEPLWTAPGGLERLELPALRTPPAAPATPADDDHPPVACAVDADADVLVIEDDLSEPTPPQTVVPVRAGDYRNLFARLRRGGWNA
jgi:type II secretory pathway predicted ATPase ExeA